MSEKVSRSDGEEAVAGDVATSVASKEDYETLLELENARTRSQARAIRKKYADSRITARKTLKLLSSLEQLTFYFQIVAFAVYLFLGYALYSGKVVYAVYDVSVFSGFFLLFFGIIGIVYAIIRAVKSKVSPIGFIVSSVLRIAVMLVLLTIETVLKLTSSGGLFGV
ncbi:MAG TPA: hypothetical protein DCO86_00750 [Spirochaetaceae bacterium]|nr:hypothetical protein [Spirochaetaceae bacterium]